MRRLALASERGRIGRKERASGLLESSQSTLDGVGKQPEQTFLQIVPQLAERFAALATQRLRKRMRLQQLGFEDKLRGYAGGEIGRGPSRMRHGDSFGDEESVATLSNEATDGAGLRDR